MASQRCYLCGKPIKSLAHIVFAEDDGGQTQVVGPDCFRRIEATGTSGFGQGDFVRLFAKKADALNFKRS
jgi:hypothetical protein